MKQMDQPLPPLEKNACAIEERQTVTLKMRCHSWLEDKGPRYWRIGRSFLCSHSGLGVMQMSTTGKDHTIWGRVHIMCSHLLNLWSHAWTAPVRGQSDLSRR